MNVDLTHAETATLVVALNMARGQELRSRVYDVLPAGERVLSPSELDDLTGKLSTPADSTFALTVNLSGQGRSALYELRRIFKRLAASDALAPSDGRYGSGEGRVLDTNGNTVGRWSW